MKLIPNTYVTGKNGHYVFKENALFSALVRASEHPDHPDLEEFFQLNAPRIPFALIEQATRFLREVYRRHKTEAILLLTFTAKDGWALYVPRQKPTGLHVLYENDEHRRVVGSIHSHPGISTRPSCTDDEDETEFDGMHFIINPLEVLPNGMTVHATVNGTRFPFKPDEILAEVPEVVEDVPAEWLAKVTHDVFLASPESLGNSDSRLLQDNLFDFDPRCWA